MWSRRHRACSGEIHELINIHAGLKCRHHFSVFTRDVQTHSEMTKTGREERLFSVGEKVCFYERILSDVKSGHRATGVLFKADDEALSK